MRLINVHTYELHEFFSEDTPDYAILSHTWHEEEVTLRHMNQLDLSVKTMKGFGKIAYTCSQARRDSLDWAWVDTCCIDKTSSAELSEAINSMFRWYQESRVCYVYLADLPDLALTRGQPPSHGDLAPCRWFTRAWCLQELLAPAILVFYSQGWHEAGRLPSLARSITWITQIPEVYLIHSKRLGEASIAARMSWAANRQCSRIEDVAYSLLGIFDVNMPLLYGEGRKAFTRLQEEIWRENDDHSLLAWCVPAGDQRAWKRTGVLAESPSDFRESSRMVSTKPEAGVPSGLTKRGLSLFVPVHPIIFPFATREGAHELVLNCGEVGDGGELDGSTAKSLSILVASTPGPSTDTFTRVATAGHFFKGAFNTWRETQRLEGGVGREKPVDSKTIYVQRKLDMTPRAKTSTVLLPSRNHALVSLHGLEWYYYTRRPWYSLRLSDILRSPWSPLLQHQWFSSVDEPVSPYSHSVVSLGEPSDMRYTTNFTAAVRMVAHDGNADGPRCIQLLLISNRKKRGKRVGMSVELRCGIKFGAENPGPLACLALLPWDDGEKQKAPADDPDPLDTTQYQERLLQHNRQLLQWTLRNLRPPRPGTLVLAEASILLEKKRPARELSVMLRLLDGDKAADALCEFPRLDLVFSHRDL